MKVAHSPNQCELFDEHFTSQVIEICEDNNCSQFAIADGNALFDSLC